MLEISICERQTHGDYALLKLGFFLGFFKNWNKICVLVWVGWGVGVSEH